MKDRSMLCLNLLFNDLDLNVFKFSSIFFLCTYVCFSSCMLYCHVNTFNCELLSLFSSMKTKQTDINEHTITTTH